MVTEFALENTRAHFRAAKLKSLTLWLFNETPLACIRQMRIGASLGVMRSQHGGTVLARMAKRLGGTNLAATVHTWKQLFNDDQKCTLVHGAAIKAIMVALKRALGLAAREAVVNWSRMVHRQVEALAFYVNPSQYHVLCVVY